MFHADSRTPQPARAFHWSPVNQRRFIEVLAETGSVRLACDAVSMARVSAYRFRRRDDAFGFRIGWDAAVLLARQMHEGLMMDYAMSPIQEVGMRNPETRRLGWRRIAPALGRGKGMALLTRLDKAYVGIAARKADYALALAALSDFDGYLELVGRGVSLGELSDFLARSGGPELQPFMCNLAQNFAISDGGQNHLARAPCR